MSDLSQTGTPPEGGSTSQEHAAPQDATPVQDPVTEAHPTTSQEAEQPAPDTASPDQVARNAAADAREGRASSPGGEPALEGGRATNRGALTHLLLDCISIYEALPDGRKDNVIRLGLEHLVKQCEARGI